MHEVCGWAIAVASTVDYVDHLSKAGRPVKDSFLHFYRFYGARGETAMNAWFKKMKQIEFDVRSTMARNAPIIMNPEDEEHFASQTHCYLCTLPFESLEVDIRSREERQEEESEPNPLLSESHAAFARKDWRRPDTAWCPSKGGASGGRHAEHERERERIDSQSRRHPRIQGILQVSRLPWPAQGERKARGGSS